MQTIAVLMRFKSFSGVRICYDANWIYRIEPIFDVKKYSLESNTCEYEHVIRMIAFLEAYASGNMGKPDVKAYHLKLSCSAFACSVYEALMEVSAGCVVSYGELAVMSGHGGAARAVGHAMHRNPFPIVIPCHRVVSSRNMWLYAYGEAMKRELLWHEGVCLN